jgi:transglutaminase-like putative cysteine protease
MALLPASVALPTPESDDLGRYLEDTITIDWQTPAVSDCARRLLAPATSPQDGIERIFHFVRDEIVHSFDLDLDLEPDRDRAGTRPTGPDRDIACRASEVLRIGHGLCFAKSHLLAALLRFAGHPTGFCYVRLVDDARPGRFVLHGFNAVYGSATGRWVLLDARGDRPGVSTECRLAPPFSLAYWPDPERGESFLPLIFKRPGRRVVDALERAPDFEALRRNLPDRLE